MSQFEWTVDGQVLWGTQHLTIKTMTRTHEMQQGELIAHFDEDHDLIIDCAWFEEEQIAADAIKALNEDGLLPEQFRDFTWENYACYAAGLRPWVTSLQAEKPCQQCGASMTRDESVSVWRREKHFQTRQICDECVKHVPDPIADNWGF